MKIAANGLSLILTQKRISTSPLLTLLLGRESMNTQQSIYAPLLDKTFETAFPTFQHRKYLFELVKLPGNIEACRRTRMSTHIIAVTSPRDCTSSWPRILHVVNYILYLSCYFAFPPRGLFIPQLSRPYPKKRDYLCHDTVRAMPVRYKTPLAPRAPLYKWT